jgi:hypothetical protein
MGRNEDPVARQRVVSAMGMLIFVHAGEEFRV